MWFSKENKCTFFVCVGSVIECATIISHSFQIFWVVLLLLKRMRVTLNLHWIHWYNYLKCIREPFCPMSVNVKANSINGSQKIIWAKQPIIINSLLHILLILIGKRIISCTFGTAQMKMTPALLWKMRFMWLDLSNHFHLMSKVKHHAATASLTVSAQFGHMNRKTFSCSYRPFSFSDAANAELKTSENRILLRQHLSP